MSNIHSKLMGLLQRAPYIGCADTDRQYAVNWLMNNGVTIFEWTLVKDRLPVEADADITGCVLAIEVSDGFARRWEISGIQEHPELFTYWMPVPALPVGESSIN